MSKKLLCLAIASTFMSCHSLADSLALEEVVVTAQKREESLQEVPLAITVTTEAQLKRDQVYSLTDLLRTTPGLEVSQTSGGESNGGGRIRGIGTNLFNETASASVAIVVDQVPQGNTPADQLFDLAQVEVLRGPQGTLFGQTASAGVINVTTKAPSTEGTSASIGMDYAWEDYDQTVIRAAVNFPLSENTAIRMAGRFKKEEGLMRNVFLGQDDKTEDTSFRVRLRSEPSDALQIDLIAEYQKKEANGLAFFSPAKAPVSNAPFDSGFLSQMNYDMCGLSNISERAGEYCSTEMSVQDKENTGLSAIINYDMGDTVLTSVTGFKSKTIETPFWDFSRRAFAAFASEQNTKGEGDQFSQELRLSSAGEDPLQYTVGAFFSKYDYETKPLIDGAFGDPFNQIGFSVCTTDAAGVPPVPPLQAAFAANGFWCPVPVLFTKTDVSVESKSVFGDITYEINEKASIFAGMRYTKQDNSYGTGINGPVSNKDSHSESNYSGRFGARWFFNDDDMLYASVSRGVKGSMIDISPNPMVPTNILNPEKATSYEIGAKVTTAEGSVVVDMNAFSTRVKDYQSQISFFVGTSLESIAQNVPSVTSKGFEIDTIAQITENFRINAGFLYNKIEYPNGYTGGDGSDLSGLQLTYAPSKKMTLSGEYTIPMDGGMEMYINGNTYWKDDVRYSDRASDLYVFPSHFNVGLSLGMRGADDAWDLRVFGRNITGENEPAAYLAGDYAGGPDGGLRAWPVAGITTKQIGVALDLNF